MWIVVVAAVLVASWLLLTWYGHRGARWGATPEELAKTLSGDVWLEKGPAVRVRMTRAAWVDAPAEQVWPWLAQLGRGAGWYSYDRLDNGGRASARHLVSWVPEPQPGDASAVGYLRHIEPGVELAWWIGGTRFFGAHVRGVTLYRVTGDGARSRLIVRIQADARGLSARPACWIFRVIDSIMAKRQLRAIKERAERFGTRTKDPERPETGARDQFQLYHVLYASGEEAGVQGTEHATLFRHAAIEDGVIES